MKIFTVSSFLLIVCLLFPITNKAQKNSRFSFFDLDQFLQYSISADLGKENPTYYFNKTRTGFRATLQPEGCYANVSITGVEFLYKDHSFTLSLNEPVNSMACLSNKSTPFSVKSDLNQIEYLINPEMTAWYINGPLGFQHGWTIFGPQPENEGELVISMNCGGNLIPSLESKQIIILKDEEGSIIFNYSGLIAYDANHRQLPVWFEKNGQKINIIVEDSEATYPVVIDPWMQVVSLLSTSKAADDYFGSSVAMSADGSTVAVGAFLTDSVAPGPFLINGTGSIYIYTIPKNEWTNTYQKAILKAKVKEKYDFLGQSVAINSDGSVIAAGAIGYDVGGTSGSGAIFVFERPSGGWVNGYQTGLLSASDKTPDDALGYSISISSDGTIIVSGANASSPEGVTNAGAIYLFSKPDSGWTDGTETAKLTASEKGVSDVLGSSVAISGDGNTIASGASGATVTNVKSAGAVFVFVKPFPNWVTGTQTAKLTASDKVSFDYLGPSVSINWDGSTIASGAIFADPEGISGAGAAYIFDKPNNSWINKTETTKLTAYDKATLENFGNSIYICPDGSTIAVGAYNAKIGNVTDAGAIYMYNKSYGEWVFSEETSKITAFNGTDDMFGRSVSMNYDGSIIVASAPQADSDGIGNAGAVYIFYEPNHTTINYAEKKDYTISPNPVSEYLYVICNEEELLSARIFDISGKIIGDYKITNGKIYLKDLNPGFYLIMIGTETYKVIKR